MEKNEYLCNVNKAEEQQFAVLTSRVSSAEREKHEAQRKVRLLEQKYSALMSEKEDVQRRLNEKMDEVADTVRQMAQFMMGKGPVTLSDSLRDAIVAGVKEEFEAKLREEREAHAKELQSLKDQFSLMLAAKDNEIAALRAKNGDGQDNTSGTTSPGSPMPEGMTPEGRIKQLSIGSPKGGERLARTLTIFANCKAYNIDPYKYLCDVFRRIKNTAKNQLVNLVAHKWQPQMAPAIY